MIVTELIKLAVGGLVDVFKQVRTRRDGTKVILLDYNYCIVLYFTDIFYDREEI